MFLKTVNSRYSIVAAKKELDSLLLSHAAYKAVMSLDKKYEGTDDYMGLSWFWNHEYADKLRPENCSVKKRVAVHDAFVAAGLDLNGQSKAHDQIIKKIVG
jgi:hypothetical protein